MTTSKAPRWYARALTLLAVSALLCACFPTGFHRRDAPDIWRHVDDSFRAANVDILVLVISEATRSGSWAQLGGVSGVRRLLREPIFTIERELKGLSAKLSVTSVDLWFPGYYFLGGWVEKSDERVIEVCLLWPDGRYLSLGEPVDDRWQRETRGLLTKEWQLNLVEAISSAELLRVASPQGACPLAGGKLNWDYATRQRVIGYLRRIAAAPER